jgi:hypothetical protein
MLVASRILFSSNWKFCAIISTVITEHGAEENGRVSLENDAFGSQVFVWVEVNRVCIIIGVTDQNRTNRAVANCVCRNARMNIRQGSDLTVRGFSFLLDP